MHFFNSLVPFLEHFRFLGYWLLFLVAFAESIAFVGLFIPGTVFVVFMGFLAAQGSFHFVDVVIFAALGAVFGDVVSFLAGQKGKKIFQRDFFVFKVSYIEKGEKFFSRHGNKSVFLGRFLGPIRPIIPFVAGLVKMDFRRFLFWNILSAIGWAALYVSLGYFFGAAWGIVQLWTTRLGVFLAILLSVVVFLYLCKLFVTRQGKQLLTFTIYIYKEAGKKILNTRYAQKFHKNFPMILPWLREWFWFLFFSITSFSFLLSLTLSVVYSHGIIASDFRLHNLLIVFGNPVLYKIFFWVTLLGSPLVVIFSSLLFCLWLWISGKKKYLTAFIATMIGSSLSSFILKLAIHRPRPIGSIVFEQTFSFPSSHATAAIALYGFLAIVCLKELSDWRSKINMVFVSLLAILAIGFSRLYLGVHFLSDVLAGFALGFLWVVIGLVINSSEERRDNHYSLSKFFFNLFSRVAPERLSRRIGWFFAFLNILLVVYLGINYQFGLRLPVKPIDQAKFISEDQIINDPDIFKVRMTETLTGKFWAPINVIFVANNETQVSDAIEVAGWSRADDNGLPALMHLFFSKVTGEQYLSVPVPAAFWNTDIQDLAFEMYDGNSKADHHIRIWKTPYLLQDSRRVYVGTLTNDVDLSWGLRHTLEPEIDRERDYFADRLVNFVKISKIDKVLPAPLRENIKRKGMRVKTDGRILYIGLF